MEFISKNIKLERHLYKEGVIFPLPPQINSESVNFIATLLSKINL